MKPIAWLDRHTAVILGIAFTMVFMLVAANVYNLSGSGIGAKGIIAALAVLSTMFTGLVSAVGILLKYAIDRRTEATREIELAKAKSLQLEAENRLKLDTAVRAVQLFAKPTGELALSIQRSGALFTLCSLGQYELTLDLLESLLRERLVDASTFSRVANILLLRDDGPLQKATITLLNAYSDELLSDGGFDLPDVMLNGCTGRTLHVRDWAPIVVAKLILGRHRSEWEKRRSAINALVASLWCMWKSEEDDRIKSNAAVILRELLDVFHPEPAIIYSAENEINTATTRNEIAHYEPRTDTVADLLTRFERWKHDAEVTQQRSDSNLT